MVIRAEFDGVILISLDDLIVEIVSVKQPEPQKLVQLFQQWQRGVSIVVPA
jgi:hypothetical protein